MDFIVGKAPQRRDPARSFKPLWDALRKTDQWVSINESDVNGKTEQSRITQLRAIGKGVGLGLQVTAEDGRIFLRNRQVRDVAIEIGRRPSRIAPDAPGAIGRAKGSPSLTNGRAIATARPPRDLDTVRAEIDQKLNDLYVLGDPEEWVSINLGSDERSWPNYQAEVLLRGYEICGKHYRIEWGMDGPLMYVRLIQREAVSDLEESCKTA